MVVDDRRRGGSQFGDVVDVISQMRVQPYGCMMLYDELRV